MRPWKIQALTPGCQRTARQLGRLTALRPFYLAGGTALALWYGHRLSVDLDFFSCANPLGFTERHLLMEELRGVQGTLEEEKEGTIHVQLKGTHVSFFRYRYPLLRPFGTWEGLSVAHPIDIGLMKLGAIIGRGSKKDFWDLYMILQKELSLRQLLRLARKKFKDTPTLALQAYRALVYFQDADQEPMPKLFLPFSWPQVKHFFESEVRLIAKNLKY